VTRDQAIVNVAVLYKPWASQRRHDRYGVILCRPNEQDLVRVRLGHADYQVHLKDLVLAPRPLADDVELIEAMEKEMKFVDDPELAEEEDCPLLRGLDVDSKKLDLIRYFEEAYGNTDQDTVVYAPEFVIVVRNILEGKRPVKLRFLTDFDGEEREGEPIQFKDSPVFCEHANECPHICKCPKNCYCKANTCREK
jgi:hypothetical protein